MSRPLQAIILMLLAMACFSAMTLGIRLLGDSMHSTQMVLMRNLIALVLIVLWCAALSRGLPNFRTRRMKSHFWRATIGLISMQLWFYSLTIIPLNLATALSFTTPIFATIFAIIFLGEKAGTRRWGGIAAGLIGMLIILRPDIGIVHPNATFVLLSSCIMAIATVLVKSLTRTESPETIVFYMALFMIPWSIPPALLHWQPISAYQGWLLLLIAFFSTAAHLMMTRAYMRVDMVVLMPFDFTRLVFTGILAYVFLGETLDAHTLTGALVIVASSVYIAHREVQKRKATFPAQ